MKPLTLIVTCYAAQYPLAGNLITFLNLPIGLSRLGHRVHLIEVSGEDQCYDPGVNDCTDDPRPGMKRVQRVLEHFAPEISYCVVDRFGMFFGMEEAELLPLCRRADGLISNGWLCWRPEFHEVKRRIYIDQDPVFTQAKLAKSSHHSMKGYASPLDHHVHFSVGLNLGRADYEAPTCGLKWQPMLPPVVFDLVEALAASSHVARQPLPLFTTVMNYSAYGSVEYNGVTYGPKSVELDKYKDLPRQIKEWFDKDSGAPQLELALAGGKAVASDFRQHGWSIVEPLDLTITPEAYLAYILRSWGEWSVAKHGYVVAQSGWFSDRTAIYLALGRPAIVEETGISKSLPVGEGLLTFSTVDENRGALESVTKQWDRHARAARRFAEEFLSHENVLRGFLAKSF